MSMIGQVSADPADLLCAAYDRIGTLTFRTSVERWDADAGVAALAAEVERAALVRLAILVCEDLARVPALAGPLCGHGISLLLVPVFARPTKDRRWERATAEAYSDATGATIVVANSLVVARIQGVDGAAGTAIAVGGGSAAVGMAAEPHDCASFRIGGGAPYLTNT